MNLVRRAAQQVGAGLSLSDFDRVLDMMYGGQPSYTGKLVSQQTALSVSAVWACVNARAKDIATLPLMTYYRTLQGRERAKNHYLWNLLQHEANPELTSWRFFHVMEVWDGLWGNAYAEIEMSGRGQVVALWPWRPDRVRINRAYPGGPLLYTYRDKNNRPFTVPRDRMLHIRGLGLDGITGLSPIEVHVQTMGLSMAVTEHTARYFSNGAMPLGALKTAQALSDKAYNRVKKDWAEQHEGLANAHRVAILEEGLDWVATGASMVDAKALEIYNLTAKDVCRIYGVPQHRVGLLEQATDNNIEELNLEYMLYELGPLAANWQSEVNCSLLSTRESDTVYTAFNFGNFLRGNHEAMAAFIAVMRQWGILNADEIREDYLDMNPQANGTGKAYWQPVNMSPEGGSNKAQDMQIVPTPKQIDQAAKALTAEMRIPAGANAQKFEGAARAFLAAIAGLQEGATS